MQYIHKTIKPLAQKQVFCLFILLTIYTPCQAMTNTKSFTKTCLTFPNFAAYKSLSELAKKPVDLTSHDLLSKERVSTFRADSCGYVMLYSTEKVNQQVMYALSNLAQEAKALEKMHQMQSGAVLNKIEGYPSDNRRVLHTAIRDFFDHPNPSPDAKEAREKSRDQHEKLKKFVAKLDQENAFTNVVSIAIGGSDLGPKALYLALEHIKTPKRPVRFISNIDPSAVTQALKGLDLEKTLVVVISKSGTTLETTTDEAFVRAAFEKLGLDPAKHFISVTQKGSPMDDQKRYLASFHMWDFVGGRFSGTSMGGAVSISLAYGHDIFWELLKGANAMDKAALEKDLSKNIPLLGALLAIWNHNFLNYPTAAIIPYSEALARFPAHIQQVEMESNGKRIDKCAMPVNFQTGPIFWGEPGTCAQHSFYQLLHQGTEIVPTELIGYKESPLNKDIEIAGTTSQEKLLANLFAQSLALAFGREHENPNKVFPGNRPSRLLLCKKLTPYSLGALFAYVEHRVAFQGFIWDINSFDQEGVELGKVLANQIIKRFSHQRKQETPQPIAGDALIDQLDLL